MPKNSLQVRGGRADKGAAEISVKRRKALARLGIAAGVAYLAPMIVRLDRAEAGHTPSECLVTPDHPHCKA